MKSLSSGGRPDNRKILRRALIVGLVLLLAVGVWAGYKFRTITANLQPDSETPREIAAALDDPVAPDSDAEPLYILVLGADRRPGQTRARADTILVVRIDPESESTIMLSIPRDTRVAVDGYGMTKINHANAYGGPALTIKTVKQYTGLPIHHYVQMDFAGLAKVVDALGGVTVTVDKPISDRHGSNTGGVSDVTEIPAGTQRLNGAQALTFARSRNYPDGDFTRVRNQQKLLAALMKEAVEARNLPRLLTVAESVANNLDTDMSISELRQLASTFKEISSGAVEGYTAPGRPQMINGVSYVVPDERESAALFEAFRNGQASTDS